jgi:hypothetical protein
MLVQAPGRSSQWTVTKCNDRVKFCVSQLPDPYGRDRYFRYVFTHIYAIRPLLVRRCQRLIPARQNNCAEIENENTTREVC